GALIGDANGLTMFRPMSNADAQLQRADGQAAPRGDPPAVGEAGEVALIAPPVAALTSSEQIDPDRTKEKIASTIIAVRSSISPQIARVLLPPPIFTLWQHF